MKNVQALLKKEQAAREVLANIGTEKEALAINKLTEVKEILTALGCDYLLETNTIERIVEREIEKIVEKVIEVEVVKEVEVIKEVEKIIEVSGPVQIVKDMEEIEKHLDTISILNTQLIAKDKELEKLKKTIATMQQNTAKKETNVEESVKTILDNRKQIERETVADMINNAPDLEEVAIEIDVTSLTKAEENSYMEFLASQEEVQEPVFETINVEEDMPQFVKVTNINTGVNDKAKMYQTEKGYLIASATTDEITWLFKDDISFKYKLAVEKMLVKEYNFLTSRTKLSPITVERDNGYLARCGAVEGQQNFSARDKVAGYVKLNGRFYLYVYQLSAVKPFLKSLDLVIAGEAHTYPKNDKAVTTVKSIIMDMVREYKIEISNLKEERDKESVKTTKEFNAKQSARKKQREEEKALLVKSGIAVQIQGGLKPGISSASSNTVDKTKKMNPILDQLAGEMF